MDARRAGLGRRGLVALVLFLATFLAAYQVAVVLLRGTPAGDPWGRRRMSGTWELLQGPEGRGARGY